MLNTAYLVLENGMIFEGGYFGARGEITGEVVFSTGMTGYLETLTDKVIMGRLSSRHFPLSATTASFPPILRALLSGLPLI